MSIPPPLPVEDEVAIRSLFGRYVHRLDSGDAEGWADLFTEDGFWHRTNSPPRHLGGSGLPAEIGRGRARLVAMAEAVYARFKGLSRHQMTDVYLEPGDGPDHVRGQSRSIITDWLDGPGKLAMVVDYKLEFQRTPAGWRIKSMTASIVPGDPPVSHQPG